MPKSKTLLLALLLGMSACGQLAGPVTATVTDQQVTPRPFGPYEVVVERQDRPQTFSSTAVYPDLDKCKAAIKGIDRYLAEVAVLDPRGSLEIPLYEPVDADQQLRLAVAYLVVKILEVEKFARMPVLTIGCQSTTPAPPSRFVCTRNQYEAGECEPQTEGVPYVLPK